MSKKIKPDANNEVIKAEAAKFNAQSEYSKLSESTKIKRARKRALKNLSKGY